MRFAIVGTRGIPARYGGFETFAEELSTRLVARGHHITVYCRQKHNAPTYRGVNLVYIPTIRHKYLDTIAHTFFSTAHLMGAKLSGNKLLDAKYDAALYCNAANAIFTWIPRLVGTPVALNVDGLERNRKKWNALAKAWYRLSEWFATWMPTVVVTDAQAIAQYYREHYKRDSVMIPYGAELGPVTTSEVLETLALEPKKYFLYVSRMEPENNALLVREAFERVSTNLKLALIGDAPYAAEYIASVRDTKDARIVMPGAIYGSGYQELGSHCFAYVHATEVGGTHPALIEAMGRGALTLYLDTPENAEVAGGAGLPFTQDNLTQVIESVLKMSEEERESWRARAMERVRSRYSWDAVTDSYEILLTNLARNKTRDLTQPEVNQEVKQTDVKPIS